jgi:transcriptional regulator with XRE-family HTH domain
MARHTKKQNLSSFALNVKAFRKLKGWTQADLARRSKVRPGTIAALETDRWRSPSASTILAIATAFGVSTDELLGVKTDEGASFANEYAASPYAALEPPTAEELNWLSQMPQVTWVGKRPTPKDIAKLIEWRRELMRK